jgi:hypothetical protein
MLRILVYTFDYTKFKQQIPINKHGFGRVREYMGLQACGEPS